MLARLANVNKDQITSKTHQALFLIAIFCGSAADLTSYWQQDLGTEEKREGFDFLTLREFPDAPGTHIYV